MEIWSVLRTSVRVSIYCLHRVASALALWHPGPCCSCPVALLVFLPAAARARVVTADFGFVPAHLLDDVVAAGAGRTRRFRRGNRAGRCRRSHQTATGGGACCARHRELRRPPWRWLRELARRPLRHRPASAATSSGRFLLQSGLSSPGRARSSPSCTRRADRAGRSRAARCLPSDGPGCRGGPSTARRRSAA